MSMSGMFTTSERDRRRLRTSPLVGAWRARVAGGDHRHFDAAAGAAADFFLVALEDVEGAGADGADA
jgi:hypothetical protein